MYRIFSSVLIINTIFSLDVASRFLIVRNKDNLQLLRLPSTSVIFRNQLEIEESMMRKYGIKRHKFAREDSKKEYSVFRQHEKHK